MVPPEAGQRAHLEACGCIVLTNFSSKPLKVEPRSVLWYLPGVSRARLPVRAAQEARNPTPSVAFCSVVTGDTPSTPCHQQHCLSPHIGGNKNERPVQRRVDGNPCLYKDVMLFVFTLGSVLHCAAGKEGTTLSAKHQV